MNKKCFFLAVIICFVLCPKASQIQDIATFRQYVVSFCREFCPLLLSYDSQISLNINCDGQNMHKMIH